MHLRHSDHDHGPPTVPVKFLLEDPEGLNEDGSDKAEHELMAAKGEHLLEVAIEAGINIEHACGGVCACSTCHVYIEKGMDDLSEPTEAEEDRVEEAPGAPTANELAAYAGRYFSDEVEAVYTLAVEGGQLVARHRRLDDVALAPAAEPDQFTGDNIALLNVAFERDDDGAVTGFRASNGRTRGVLFERFDR